MTEKNFLELLDLSSQLMWEIDPNGFIKYVSEGAQECLGYLPEEMVGHKITEFLNKKSPNYQLFSKPKLATKKPFQEARQQYIHKSGKIVNTVSTAIPTFDKKKSFTGYMGIDKNISSLVNLEKSFEEVQKLTGLGSWELDLITHTQHWSDETFRILGEEPQSFQPDMDNFMDYLDEKEQKRVQSAMENALSGTEDYDLFHDITRKDGEIRNIHARAKIIHDDNGKPIKLIGTALDITERRKLENEVADTLHTLDSVINNVNNLIFYKDKNYTYLGCNSPFEEFIGRKKEDIIGHNDFEFFPLEEAEHFRAMDRETVQNGKIVYNSQWVIYPGGREVYLHTTTSPFYDREGNIAGLVGNAVDITKEKILSDKLEYQAMYDALTEIPNRTLFMDRLEQTVRSSHRHRNGYAVFFIDLDEFKMINDKYGHKYGDMVLKEVARRLVTTLRENDTVARIGGDEFAAIVTDVFEEESVHVIVNKLIKSLKQPIIIDTNSFTTTASIGIAMHPKRPLAEAEELLIMADDAMYKAKEKGKNRYVFAE